jgi:hypothetical protein
LSGPPRSSGTRARRADDILPTFTSFTVPATSVDVTYGDAHITVTMSGSDPDATGVGTGDINRVRPGLSRVSHQRRV